MKNKILISIVIGLLITSISSCSKDKDEPNIKQANGTLWISGGLYHCATQIHLDTHDTLIVNTEDISSLKTGDKVNVRYKEIGLNEFCSPYINCEIIEIIKNE